MGKLMDKVWTFFDIAKGTGIILGGLSVIGSLFGIFIKAGKLLRTIEVLKRDTTELKESVTKNQKEIKDILTANHNEMKQNLHEMKSDIKETRRDLLKTNENISSIDAGLAKLEGAFEERGKWESRHSVGT